MTQEPAADLGRLPGGDRQAGMFRVGIPGPGFRFRGQQQEQPAGAQRADHRTEGLRIEPGIGIEHHRIELLAELPSSRLPGQGTDAGGDRIAQPQQARRAQRRQQRLGLRQTPAVLAAERDRGTMAGTRGIVQKPDQPSG